MLFSTVLLLISTTAAAASTLRHGTRQAANTNAQTISAKTGLTDQEALDIFNTLDTQDGTADGFSADETTDIVRQGLAEFREQNGIAEGSDDEADDALPEGADDEE